MAVDFENLFDEELDKLITAGAITGYSWREFHQHPFSQFLEIELSNGTKLGVSSWSTPAPESSGLSVETF